MRSVRTRSVPTFYGILLIRTSRKSASCLGTAVDSCERSLSSIGRLHRRYSLLPRRPAGQPRYRPPHRFPPRRPTDQPQYQFHRPPPRRPAGQIPHRRSHRTPPHRPAGQARWRQPHRRLHRPVNQSLFQQPGHLTSPPGRKHPASARTSLVCGLPNPPP